MSSRLLRVGRWLAVVAFVAALAVLISAWVWRGYEPPMRIEGQSIGPLAFSPSGDVLAVGSMAMGGSFLMKPVGPIRFLSALDGAEVQPALITFKDPKYPVSVLRADFSPDGKRFAVLQAHTYNELNLIVFDLATRKPIAEQTIPYSSYAGSSPDSSVMYRFSPDSSFIVSCGQVIREPRTFSHRSVVVLDLATGKQRFDLEKTGFPEVSPDSRLLATLDDTPPGVYDKNQVLKLWNIQSGQVERSIELAGGPSGYATTWPSFSPDGRLLAACSTASGNSTTEVFDTTTGKRVFEQKTWAPRFLSDGTLVTVWGLDVQLWDAASGQLKRAHAFDLGRHWDNGDQISPRPQVTPGQPRVAVFNYYPSRYGAPLRWLARHGQVNKFGSNQMTLIDAAQDTRQPIELHENMLMASSLCSPNGVRMALGYLDGNVEILNLPPQPSYVAPWSAAALVVVPAVLLLALRRRTRRAGDRETPEPE